MIVLIISRIGLLINKNLLDNLCIAFIHKMWLRKPPIKQFPINVIQKILHFFIRLNMTNNDCSG